MTPLRILLALLLVLLPASLRAQEAQRREGGPPPSPPAAHKLLLPPTAVTEHTITIAGHTLAYTATAGTLLLKDGSGETTAEIFYASFMLNNAGDAAHRPITYFVNGGPGASAAYLDIGAVGPRALAFPADGTMPPLGAEVVDNPDTWLPFTDLVFIDPVGAGWSRATDEDKAAKEFWTVSQDLKSIEEIVRLHLTMTGRLGSPVYFAGESYGGFRAARLARELAVDDGIAPAGIIMVSPVIDFGLMFGGPLDILPWALRLPSYAATLRGDKALAGDGLSDVESFAMHDYLVALAAGPQPGPETTALYQKLASLTGLEADQIARWRGRIPLRAFTREVDRRDGRIVSIYDSDVSAPDPDPLNERGRHDDPVLDASIAPFTSAFTAYAANELGYKTDQPFHLLNPEVGRHWDWETGHNTSADVSADTDLARALALEPQLKVMIANGVTDLVTPYMMNRYVKDHMPGSLGERIALKLYAGGHMLYLHPDSRHRLREDAAKFYGTPEN
jgi:carboxypeptidase C (cathepsin A)